jgi:cold shock protein
MMQGTVKWYNDGQGRGIIVQKSGGAEISVACSDIAAEGFKVLFEGQQVMFDIIQTKRGPAAKNVTVFGDE